MKYARALKTYLEGDMHVEGQKASLEELKYLLADDRAAGIEELRSYGFEIEESE